jgi:hypothetical protein
VRKKEQRTRQEKISEQDPYATKKQMASQHQFKARALKGSYDMQSTRLGNYHGATELSLGLENPLPLPSVTASQLIEPTYKSTPTPLSKADNLFDPTCVPTSVFDLRYLICPVLDCPCEDKSPFHEGYAAMTNSGNSCAYCGETFLQRL